MFDSDDENAETFPGSVAAFDLPVAPSSTIRSLPRPRPNPNGASQRSQQPHNYGPVRSAPWNVNEVVIIPEADEDPFINFPDDVPFNGFVITNEIPRNRGDYSFMVYCQEDHQIYGIPRKLTTPPFGIKLNAEQRWRKKRDLEFGRKVDIIIKPNRYNVVEVAEYAKGPADSIIAENIEGKNCFQVQCVLGPDLMTFYCLEFGESRMPRPLAFHIENLAYECQVTFNEEAAIRRTPHFEIFKVVKASADQSISGATPWIKRSPTAVLSDNDIEELKNPENYKANVTGLRYANDRVLHLRAENNVKIIFCTDFDNLPPIGSIFQFDYVFHPVKKLAVVADVIRVDEQLPTIAIENGEDDESDFMFEMSLFVGAEKNGFYHDPTLGMIADTTRCLRFTPYCELQRPSEYINVRVKACLRQPALFDIVEICEDSIEDVKACEPPFVQADGIMVNVKSGKIFSSQFPGLDLRIAEKNRHKFRIGEFINGQFQLRNLDDMRDNQYISYDAVKTKTEPLKTLAITDDYALVVSKLRRIRYTAPVSKKQMKKNPQAEDIIETFREYSFFLQNYFEATHGGLIAGSKGRVSASDGDYAYAILETLPDGGQCVFNYVSKYEERRYPLDLEENTMLKNHVMKVIEASEGIHHHEHRSRHASVAASVSSRASSIPSTRSSSSMQLPPYDYDRSSRASTPLAEGGRYSEVSTQSMNSEYVRSERFQSPEEFPDFHRASRNDDRYSQNEYRNERGDSRISANGGNESRDSRMSANHQNERRDSRMSENRGNESRDSRMSEYGGYERADARMSVNSGYERGDSRMSVNSGYERGDSRMSANGGRGDSQMSYVTAQSTPYPPGFGRPPPHDSEPRHRYDRAVQDRTPPAGYARLPPTAASGRSSVQLPAGIRLKNVPSNSAPTSQPQSSWASRASSISETYYANDNIRNAPRSPSPTNQTPPRPSPAGSTWANRVSAHSGGIIPPPPLPPRSTASTRPQSGTSSIHSQNGIARAQILSPNQRHESSAVDEVTGRMNNAGITSGPYREMFPQLGGPRYRNMCLYDRGENISPALAAILEQMDALLTNPAPPITESIKLTREETSMPDFEKFVDKLLN